MVAAVVTVCAAVVLLLLLFVLAVTIRRVALRRGVGCFDCSVRQPGAVPGRGWSLGLARYRDDRIDWFRIFSATPLPGLQWSRRELEIDGWREPGEAEAAALPAGSVVVACRCGELTFDLAVSPEVQAGLCSWLESAPPGQVRTAL